MIDAWTSWLSPVPWALQLHANCREPLGAGSWAHFLALARHHLEQLGAMPIVAFGCTQPNKDRDRLHLHALLAPAWPAPVNARDVLLKLPRWTGPQPLGKFLEEKLGELHAVSRPYDFRLGDGESTRPAAVKLGPVTPRGKATDHTSLVHYIVRYLLRFDAGDWLEDGDLAPYVAATSVSYSTVPPFTNERLNQAISRDRATRVALGLVSASNG